MNFLEETSQSPVESENSLWVEKYRPKDLSDYIGNDALKKRAADWIANNDIPHLLLYGKAGTGKTTVGKLITKQIQCDHLGCTTWRPPTLDGASCTITNLQEGE